MADNDISNVLRSLLALPEVTRWLGSCCLMYPAIVCVHARRNLSGLALASFANSLAIIVGSLR